MDALDQEILSLLQHDGRMSATDLASEVGLTTLQLHGGESATDFARARDAG
ncbi:AsnC family transcriptional regulator, partial [Bacillus sp. S34]|nr:AsnC family transcriptional regulator [Bacillus sp. S34]